MPRVWLVTGEKGGIGKSLFAMTLACFLQGEKRRVAVVDFDFRNADVVAGDLKIRINLNQSVNLSVGEYEDLKMLEPSTEVVINTPGVFLDPAIQNRHDVALRVALGSRQLILCWLFAGDQESGKALAVYLKKFSSWNPKIALVYSHNSLVFKGRHFLPDCLNNREFVKINVLQGEGDMIRNFIASRVGFEKVENLIKSENFYDQIVGLEMEAFFTTMMNRLEETLKEWI